MDRSAGEPPLPAEDREQQEAGERHADDHGPDRDGPPVSFGERHAQARDGAGLRRTGFRSGSGADVARIEGDRGREGKGQSLGRVQVDRFDGRGARQRLHLVQVLHEREVGPLAAGGHRDAGEVARRRRVGAAGVRLTTCTPRRWRRSAGTGSRRQIRRGRHLRVDPADRRLVLGRLRLGLLERVQLRAQRLLLGLRVLELVLGLGDLPHLGNDEEDHQEEASTRRPRRRSRSPAYPAPVSPACRPRGVTAASVRSTPDV